MEPSAVMPICPSCKTQPLPITMHVIDLPTGMVIGMMCCMFCGHIVTCIPLGMKEPQLVGANGQGLRIVKPS